MRYLIQKGDTLTSIAKRHGVSVADIMLANPMIKNQDLIYAGDVITIPVIVGQVRGWFQRILDWFKYPR